MPTFTPDAWRRIQTILDEVLRAPPAERHEALDRACGDETDLRRAVESLIVAAETEDARLDRPAVDLRPLAEEPEPTRIGPYRILRRIGAGGMGTVFLAERDDTYRQKVALKVLRESWADPALIRRFRNERQILASLEHPNIARLLDGGTTERGVPFLVMEAVDGVPIDRFVAERQISLDERVDLVRKVCDAVQFAHRSLVVHRDLKPANILVTADGEPKLLDFGIAKLLAPEAFPQTVMPTASGLTPMTPQYASPEQVLGKPITTATDVHALGLILFELLTGRRPFATEEEAPLATLERIGRTEAPRPSAAVLAPGSDDATDPDRLRLGKALRGDLDNIVLKALAKEPLDRYAGPAALADDLERYRRGLPVHARPDSFRYRASKFVRRHKLAVAAAGLFVIVLLAWSLTLAVAQRRTLEQRNRAEATAAFLTELFASAEPYVARGDDVTARQLLDRGVDEIESALADQPDVQGDLLETMGRSYLNLSLFADAERLLLRSLSLRRTRDGETSLAVAASRQALAELALRRNEQDLAIEHGRAALAVREKRLPSPHEATVRSQRYLAMAYDQAGDLEIAERHFEEALRVARRLPGRESLAEVLDRYAIYLRGRARYDDAEALYREALALNRSLYGDRHPETARNLHNLGALFEARGDYEDAEAHYRQAVELQTVLFGGPHTELAASLQALAGLLRRRDRLDEAQELLDEVLSMRRLLYGEPSAPVAVTLRLLAEVETSRNRPEEAESLHRRALAMQIEALGEEHLETAVTEDRLGRLLVGQDRLEEAETLLAHALGVRRAVLGDGHPSVAVSVNNLADLHAARGEPEMAEALYREALDGLRRVHGTEHADVAAMLLNLASVERAQGKLDEAAARYAEAEAVLRRVHGAEHRLVGLAMIGRGAVNLETGDPTGAEAAARAALDVFGHGLPEGHPWWSSGRNLLGRSLFAQDRFAEAEPLLVGRYEALRKRRGDQHASTTQARERLVELYEAWGSPERAAPYRAAP